MSQREINNHLKVHRTGNAGYQIRPKNFKAIETILNKVPILVRFFFFSHTKPPPLSPRKTNPF